MSEQNKIIVITPHDLPLHCAGPVNETWNRHPRVLLPLESNSTIECPHYGAVYKLEGEAKHH